MTGMEKEAFTKRWAASRAKNRERKRAARDAWRQTGVGWRVFPRTLLGICFTLLAFGVGSGVAGAFLYVYYDARMTENEELVTNAKQELEQTEDRVVGAITESAVQGSLRLERTLGPYAAFMQDDLGLPRAAGGIAPSLVQVTSSSQSGEPTFATGVALGPSGSNTVFVTSYAVVAAATADPGPEIEIRWEERTYRGEIWGWDRELGVAVLTSDAQVPSATLATGTEVATTVGTPVFAVSAFNLATTPGTVATVTSRGVRHTAPLGPDMFGGPLVDVDGRVLAVNLGQYAPGGYGGGNAPWSVPLGLLCEELLRCQGEVSLR